MWDKVSQESSKVEARDSHVVEEGAQMGVFVNTYTHSLDSKKRLTIPSEWRELVGVPKRLFVLPGIQEKCLCVYPAREMTRRMESLRNLSIADERGRQLARTLASRSDWCPWDAQGRIRIKDDLLDYASLTNQVVLVGTFDGFELWDPDRWSKVDTSANPDVLGDAAKYVGF